MILQLFALFLRLILPLHPSVPWVEFLRQDARIGTRDESLDVMNLDSEL